MTQQADSTLQAWTFEIPSEEATPVQKVELTPRVVIGWLPPGATPAQQDSMVQKYCKFSEIHWSERPDTLHLPGHSAGKSFRNISLPQYYRESFFSKSPMFHPELSGGRQGVAGDPVPYTIAGDNLITGLLLGSLIFALVSFAQSRNFIVRQLKNIFRVQHDGTTEMTETSAELRFQFVMALQTCLLGALGYFFYIGGDAEDTFIIPQYQVIGLFTGVLALFFVLKALVYALVGWVFFEKKNVDTWQKTYLFLVSSLSALLFPVIMLSSYFHISMAVAVVYTIIVIVLLKILTFYKSYLIFFRRKGVVSQIFLYFCALEIVPTLSLWGVFVLISSILKINF